MNSCGTLWFTEAVVQRCSVKMVFLEFSQNSQENTCARVSFLIKLQASGLSCRPLLKKRLLAQVFSCEFCEISKNTFFYGTPLVAASGFNIPGMKIVFFIQMRNFLF